MLMDLFFIVFVLSGYDNKLLLLTWLKLPGSCSYVWELDSGRDLLLDL